ncbi:hypothetical protein CLV59_1117 [Chitinophaga dinghuensis]|uniref:Uncharacterized protein n=1 Tax=Chitinophaga dinghuensis TaxID=1539050 RepID=A0A327VL45_9BACT|nr:hypothetical protein [Chitinophaga dinghuensis]RAJ73888.1 hypothetical protein CLV59_1117 [Chitinophaga dinghuensis]
MGRFRQKSAGKIFLMICCGIAFIAAVTLLTMILWNWLIPEIFHGPSITYWQAFGLLLLGKLLFGWHNNGKGFKGRGGDWKERIRNKMAHLSPEEQEHLREKLRNRCGGSEHFERHFDRFWNDRDEKKDDPAQNPGNNPSTSL